LALAIWVAGHLDALSLGKEVGTALGVNRPLVLGLSLLALSLGGIAMVWTDRYRELLQVFA